ncbi:hypothetical protein BC829DRAFT_449179 [Chytridium lagenaria]|nr:hypothetical protein BC829DRAFT_449179 [Chytridium lagenaria]
MSNQKIFTSQVKDVNIPDVDIHTYVFSQAKQYSNKTYLIDAATDRSITVGQFTEKVERFASGLRKGLGINRWDVVGIFSPNHFDYGVVIHGTVRAAATITSANPSYTSPELAHQLRDSGAKILFTVPELLPIALPACAEVGISPQNVLLLSTTLPELPKEAVEAAKNFKTLEDVLAASNERLPPVTLTRDELRNKPVYICYSSGTTGKPKGVVTTHYNMIANIAQIDALLNTAGDAKPGDAWVGVLPFFHMYGLSLSLHVALFKGISLVVISRFELEPFLAALAKYKVVTAHIVPPIAVALAKHPIVDKFDLTNLKVVFSGAAPLGPELSKEVAKRLKVEVLQGYGMTELSPVATMGTSIKNIYGSVGILAPNMEARLVSPITGDDMGVGHEGRRLVKTGDVAVIDAEGYYYRAYQIQGFPSRPAELEAHLLTHPAIADAAVIPRPDEAAGELPRAYVVLKPNVTATEADVQKFIEAKVAPHKRLRGGVVFIDIIPKSPSGKILRRVLRDREAEERGAQKAHAKL